MKKIYELLRLPVQKADVGIEIEVEGKGLVPIVSKYWKSEDDGSLRGQYPESRAEYVIHTPIMITQVKDAMKELNELLKKSILNFSFRTSVHVHVNVQHITEMQLLNLVYTYLLIEEPLMNYCGKERKGNRFCLRLQDAEGLLETVMHLVNGGVASLVRIGEDSIRYSAINLAAVRKYGTVEFRGMRGNADENVINTWANAVVALRTFACKQESPQAIYDKFVQMNGEGFLEEVLGDYAKAFVYPKMAKDLQRSFSLSIDIPFAAARAEAKKAEKGKDADLEFNPDAPRMARPGDFQRMIADMHEEIAVVPAGMWDRPAVNLAAPAAVPRRGARRPAAVIIDDAIPGEMLQ